MNKLSDRLFLFRLILLNRPPLPQRSPGNTLGRRRQVAPLPSLETNLHKILARKIQDSEEVSFRKSKLLTMAYYKLLRESPKPLVDPKVQVSLYLLRISVGRIP